MTLIVEWFRSRAHADYEKGRIRQAKLLLAIARFGGGGDSWLLDFEGLIAREQGDIETAIDKFRQAVQADARNTRAWERLAICLARSEAHDEAIEIGSRLLITGDVSAIFAYRLGEALIDHGATHAMALEWFRRATAIDPEFDISKLCEAHCLLNLGHVEDARQRYEKLAATSGQPSIVLRARKGVAKAKFDQGLGSEALDMARKIVLGPEMRKVPRDERDSAEAFLAWLETELGE